MSCGCNDTSLPLSNCNPCADCPPTNAVNLPPCIGGEPCEEVNKVDCVSFVGPNLPALSVLNGDRLITILTKLHRVVTGLQVSPPLVVSYAATATTATPMVVTYLGLGPVYTSTPGATGSTTTITVGSTTGLEVGMTVEVVSGTGAFPADTTVTAITSLTEFVVSAAPTTALANNAVVKATGSEHKIFTITVVQGTPQSFKAFEGSPVKVSGTGTIV